MMVVYQMIYGLILWSHCERIWKTAPSVSNPQIGRAKGFYWFEQGSVDTGCHCSYDLRADMLIS